MPVANDDDLWNVVPIREDDLEFAPYPDEASAEDAPLPGVVDPSSWGDERAPFRRFLIDGWIIRGAAGLLSGQEGVGKSLLAQQMATCAAVGRNFLGLEVEQVKSIYITCEDPMDELRRRQESINAALGITMADLEGKLLLVSLKGQINNELGTFDQAGRLSIAVRYRQIHKVVTEFGAELAFLDNAAHLFAGNENARHDVAAFLGLLERLAEEMDGAVILLAHPNKAHAQGNKQGNEFSGSTGWSAHVRSRMFLDWKSEGDDGVPTDPDARILRKSKANYGKKGEQIDFRWHEWAFSTLADLPADTAREIARAAQDASLNDIFLRCLDKATEERRPTSASSAASNYAPRIFAKMTTARGAPLKLLEEAMNRLFHLKFILNDQKLWQRPNRNWVTGISRSEKCTNPRTNHARSDAQSMHEAHDGPSGKCTDPHPAHTPSTTYIGEALEAPQSMYDGDEPPSWMDEAPALEPDTSRPDLDWMDNPILNRGD